MPLYSIHYRFQETVLNSVGIEDLVANQSNPEHFRNQMQYFERHARTVIDFPVNIEYEDDLRGIVEWLQEQFRPENPMLSNFEVLSWQPLLGLQRPTES